MRQLEEALHALAKQDERLSTGELITRIERGLSGKGITTVAINDGASAMDAHGNTRQDRRRAQILMATGAVLLTLIVVGLPILFVRGQESLVTEQTRTTVTITDRDPTTVTVTAPAETAAPTIPVALPMEWQRHSDDTSLANSSILTVTAGGPGFVAGGIVFDEEAYLDAYLEGVYSPPGTAALWVSESGTSWERIDDSMLLTGEDIPAASAISDLAAGPLGFVAVGSSGLDPAIWISPDALSWTRVFDDDLSREGYHTILGVTAGGPGWVAVGDGDFDAPVWVSHDGVEWVLIDDEDLLGGENVHADLYDVTVGGPGLVAVGSVGFTEGTGITAQQAAVWVSVNGLDWSRLPDDSFSGNRVFESVTADPASDRLIAFGTPHGTWHSTNGQQWFTAEQSESQETPPPSSSVGWDGDQLVAAGPDMTLSIWTSVNGGRSWQRIEHGGETFASSDRANGVLALDSDFVIVGEAIGLPGEPPSGVVWIGTMG